MNLCVFIIMSPTSHHEIVNVSTAQTALLVKVRPAAFFSWLGFCPASFDSIARQDENKKSVRKRMLVLFIVLSSGACPVPCYDR